MRHLLVRIFVNASALGLTVFLMPGITVALPDVGLIGRIITYLILGVLFGLVNTVIRPVVFFLTGRLLIWSFGVFALVLNVLLFAFFASNEQWIFSSPKLLWILLGSLVMSYLVFVLEGIFGLDSPTLGVNKHRRRYWGWLGKIPGGRGNFIVENLRLGQTYDTMMRYGHDILAGNSPWRGVRQAMQRFMYGQDLAVTQGGTAAKVRLMLQDLGPTYVKVGQMVSSRAEALPAEWRDELTKLQNDVPPFPYEEACKIITAELGAPPEKLFATFDRLPFAAASTAQVHHATLDDGLAVVVKVQRPDIDVTVQGDLRIMQRVVQTLERRAAWARNYDLSGFLAEFSSNIIRELDYRNEALNARRLAFAMCKFDEIHVPAITMNRSATRVLTMEFVKGVKITNVAALDGAGVDRNALARTFMRAMIQQVLFDGFFHGDPHPGNVLVDLETSRIIFLDTGMMGELSADQCLALADLIWSLHEKDGRELARVMLQLTIRFKQVNEVAFERDITALIDRYLVYGDANASFSLMVTEILSLMYRHGLRMDQDLTLALKALIQLEEILSVLDPTFGMLAAAYEEGQRLLRQQFEAGTLRASIRRQGIRTVKEVIRRLPALQEGALRWLDQIESGKLVLHVDTGDLITQIDEVEQTINTNAGRLGMSLLLVGLLVGSAIASTAPIVDERAYLTTFALALFILSGVVAFFLVIGGVRAAFQRGP